MLMMAAMSALVVSGFRRTTSKSRAPAAAGAWASARGRSRLRERRDDHAIGLLVVRVVKAEAARWDRSVRDVDALPAGALAVLVHTAVDAGAPAAETLEKPRTPVTQRRRR